jgi:hypothetical protein
MHIAPATRQAGPLGVGTTESDHLRENKLRATRTGEAEQPPTASIRDSSATFVAVVPR